ncbi:hypothetical protein DIPPA_28865 [Diplonema papillatum]|nr:hypothetical protein DIPPA_28865 [Diplonema papillatum]
MLPPDAADTADAGLADDDASWLRSLGIPDARREGGRWVPVGHHRLASGSLLAEVAAELNPAVDLLRASSGSHKHLASSHKKMKGIDKISASPVAPLAAADPQQPPPAVVRCSRTGEALCVHPDNDSIPRLINWQLTRELLTAVGLHLSDATFFTLLSGNPAAASAVLRAVRLRFRSKPPDATPRASPTCPVRAVLAAITPDPASPPTLLGDLRRVSVTSLTEDPRHRAVVAQGGDQRRRPTPPLVREPSRTAETPAANDAEGLPGSASEIHPSVAPLALRHAEPVPSRTAATPAANEAEGLPGSASKIHPSVAPLALHHAEPVPGRAAGAGGGVQDPSSASPGGVLGTLSGASQRGIFPRKQPFLQQMAPWAAPDPAARAQSTVGTAAIAARLPNPSSDGSDHLPVRPVSLALYGKRAGRKRCPLAGSLSESRKPREPDRCGGSSGEESREGSKGLSAAVQFEDVLLCCEVVGTEEDVGRAAVLGGEGAEREVLYQMEKVARKSRVPPAQRKALLSELDELQARVAAQRQEMARLKQPAKPAQGGRPSPWFSPRLLRENRCHPGTATPHSTGLSEG